MRTVVAIPLAAQWYCVGMATSLNESTSGDLNRYVIVGGGIAGVSCAEEVIKLIFKPSTCNLLQACVYVQTS